MSHKIKDRFPWLWLLLIMTGAALVLPSIVGEEMKNTKQLAVGDPAPMFELPGSDGKIHGLADHQGKRPVVIAWFPKAFTGG